MELIAVLLTLTCVWLTYKDQRSSWLVNIASCIIYAIVFWNQKLYADFGLQIIFFIQGFHGFYNWKKIKKHDVKPINFTLLLWIGSICWLILYNILNKTDASYPGLDSFLSISSIIANQALVFHWRQAWLLWALLDVIYVGLFLTKGMWYSTILYVILTFIAIMAFKQWKTKNIN